MKWNMGAQFLLTVGLLLTGCHLSVQSFGDESYQKYPLGCFHFDFARLGKSKAEQIDTLQKLGYEGMVYNLVNQPQLNHFNQYLDVIEGTGFKVYAAYVPVTFKQDNSKHFAHIKKVLGRLKQANASLWIIAKDDELDRAARVEALNHIADMASETGVEFVIYPHDRTSIESAEDALEYILEMDRDDVYLSLHLCHEIRAGNGERLNEVAAKVKPWLRLPSISGTDSEYEGAAIADWSKNIKPLGDGDYDAIKLLIALQSIDYDGPVMLHTFGLEKVRISHHADSIKGYYEMLKQLNDD